VLDIGSGTTGGASGLLESDLASTLRLDLVPNSRVSIDDLASAGSNDWASVIAGSMDVGADTTLDSLFGRQGALEDTVSAFGHSAADAFGFPAHAAVDAPMPDMGAFDLQHTLFAQNEHRVL